MFIYKLCSKSKSELFGFERGGRWRSRQMKTLVDTKILWREVANGTLKGFRISLPLDQHRVVIFINLIGSSTIGDPVLYVNCPMYGAKKLRGE